MKAAHDTPPRHHAYSANHLGSCTSPRLRVGPTVSTAVHTSPHGIFQKLMTVLCLQLQADRVVRVMWTQQSRKIRFGRCFTGRSPGVEGTDSGEFGAFPADHLLRPSSQPEASITGESPEGVRFPCLAPVVWASRPPEGCARLSTQTTSSV